MSPGLQRTQLSPPSSPRQFSQATGEGATGEVSESATSASAAASAASAFDTMWGKIEAHRRTTSEKPNYFSSTTVRPNHTGVLCPENNDTLKVRIDNEPDSVPVPIHANYVQLSTTGCYAVGQSPDDNFELGCTRDLIHSLDSGRGLFQFTSRTAHRYDGERGSANSTIRNERSLSTIASMIEAQRQPSGVLPTLGGRYEITKFEALPYDPAEKKYATRYKLTATDIHTRESKTVCITQAGLPFVHKLLEPRYIIRAAALLDTHPESILATPLNDAHQQTGPLICSAAGIGRSAVLAVYQDLCNRMPNDVDESNLNAHLEAAIKKGIEARGPKFLYSKKQVEALREALLIKMRKARGSPGNRHIAAQNLFDQLRRQTDECVSEQNEAGNAEVSASASVTDQGVASESLPSRAGEPDLALLSPQLLGGVGSTAQNDHVSNGERAVEQEGERAAQQVVPGAGVSDAALAANLGDRASNVGSSAAQGGTAPYAASTAVLRDPASDTALSAAQEGTVSYEASPVIQGDAASDAALSAAQGGRASDTASPAVLGDPASDTALSSSQGGRASDAAILAEQGHGAGGIAPDAAQRITTIEPALPAVISPRFTPAPTGPDNAESPVVENNQNDNQRHVRFAPGSANMKRRYRSTSDFAREPIQLYHKCRDALRKANQNGATFFEFPPGPFLQKGVRRGDTEPLPDVHAVALAVATISQFTTTRGVVLTSATIGFETDAQKQVLKNLQARVDTFTQSRVLQALVRPFIRHRMKSTPLEDFFDRTKLAVFPLPEINDEIDNCEEISEEPEGLKRKLNDVKLDTWKNVPITAQDWLDDANLIEEPALANDCHSAAAVVVEKKDGRVWVGAPTNQEGNKENTFPSGPIGNNSGLTAQTCARKEAYQRLGLQISLTRQLIDIRDATGTTRYYLAERTGGTPADASFKSQAVSLVPMRKALTMFEDDGKFAYGRERDVLKVLQQSMLITRLIADTALARSIEVLREWIPDILASLKKDSRALEGANNRFAYQLDNNFRILSDQISRVVKNWRIENLRLTGYDPENPNIPRPHIDTMLKTPTGSVTPYLHANRIPFDNCSIQFIAAQRPYIVPAAANNSGNLRRTLQNMVRVKPPTSADTGYDNVVTFWQTALQEKVDLIVDITGAQSKELSYGPFKNSEMDIGVRRLVHKGDRSYGGYPVEEIEARDSGNDVTNRVNRLNYFAWPDGTAISPDALIVLAGAVSLAVPGPGAKVLVHSTNGDGRAGTLITFIAASEQIRRSLTLPTETMPLKKFCDIVMNIIVRGRVERDVGFVDSTQIKLLVAALLQKHFARVERVDRENVVLVSR